jgi:NH3-dependent NAD+ synthetase
MVMTNVTIQGQTLEMWLPVMDGANKAMKHEAYSYATRYGDKSVEQASMFDINKTLMRCLVKNLAMFGLGHYIFAGEDLPESESDAIANTTSKPIAKATASKAEQTSTKPQLKKGTEDWDKVAKWIGDNKEKTIEDIEKILKSRFTIAPAALKELGLILTTNG